MPVHMPSAHRELAHNLLRPIAVMDVKVDDGDPRGAWHARAQRVRSADHHRVEHAEPARHGARYESTHACVVAGRAHEA